MKSLVNILLTTIIFVFSFLVPSEIVIVIAVLFACTYIFELKKRDVYKRLIFILVVAGLFYLREFELVILMSYFVLILKDLELLLDNRIIKRDKKHYISITSFILLAISLLSIHFSLGTNFSYSYLLILSFIFLFEPSRLFQLLFLSVSRKKLSDKNIKVNIERIILLVSQTKNLILNKTGTITTGNLKVVKVETNDKEKLLFYLNCGEVKVNDRIAKAIISYKKVAFDERTIKDHKYYKNGGVTFTYGKKEIVIGSHTFLKEQGIDVIKNEAIGSIVYCMEDKKLIGTVILADEIRNKSKNDIDLINNLKNLNISVLSHDETKITSLTSRAIGIENHYSCLTDEKYSFWIYYLKKMTPGVTVVVNDEDMEKNNADIFILSNPNIDKNTRNSDIIIKDNNLEKIYDLMKTSIRTKEYYHNSLVLEIWIRIISLFVSFYMLENVCLLLIVYISLNIFYLPSLIKHRIVKK